VALSIGSLMQYTSQVGIEALATVYPEMLEDACYSIFNSFKNVAAVSVSKPVCTRAIVYGTGFEMRFFSRGSTGEAYISITSFSEAPNKLRDAVQSAMRVFDVVRRVLRGFVVEWREVRVHIKSVTSVSQRKLGDIVKVLQEHFGVVTQTSELRDINESTIYIVSGVLVRRELRSYSVRMIAVVRRSPMATVSISIEGRCGIDEVEEELSKMSGLTRALMDSIALVCE